MRCPKCDTEILDNSKICPNCKTFISNDDDFNIELPMVKNAPKEEPIEEPKTEENPDTIEQNLNYETPEIEPEKEIELEPSNENIDAIKDTEGVSSPTVNDILEYEPDLPETKEEETEKIIEQNEKETLKVKKNYLFVCCGIGILVLLAILFVLGAIRNNNTNKYDLKGQINRALSNYYNSNGDNYNDLNTVLEHVYKEENKLDAARDETYHHLDEWMDEYLNVEAKNAEEFSNATAKYRKIVNNIYKNVEVENVKLVEEAKYNDYIAKIDRISIDSKIFYKALDSYNNNDYNDAYLIFSEIDETNLYHQKAEDYKTKIVNTIMSFIKKDIAIKEAGIDEKTPEEKLATYNEIIDIINKYSNAYPNLKLNENELFKEYLNNYQNRAAENNM